MTKWLTRLSGKKFGEEEPLSYAVMSPFLFLTLQFFILNVFDLFGTRFQTTLRIITIGLVGLFFLSSFLVVLRRSLRFSLVSYTIAFVVLAVNYYLYYQNRPYIREELFSLMFISLPVMIYVYSVQDVEVFINAVRYTSYAIGILATATGLIKLWGTIDGKMYSMPLAYYLLFPSIILVSDLFKKFSMIKLLALLLLLLLIIIKGARGPLGSLIVFIVLMCLSPKISLHSQKKYNLLLKGAVLITLGITIIFSQPIFSGIGSLTDAMGINSRTVNIFSGKIVQNPDNPNLMTSSNKTEDISANPLYLSGRLTLYTKVWEAISSSGIRPLGFMSDRVLLNGGYVHNIFLEILAHFGLLIGIFLFLVCCGLGLMALIRADKIQYELLAIWIALGLVPLLYSGSYVSSMHFWLLMGLVFGSMRKRTASKSTKISNSFT